jgi:hypothetical protein
MGAQDTDLALAIKAKVGGQALRWRRKQHPGSSPPPPLAVLQLVARNTRRARAECGGSPCPLPHPALPSRAPHTPPHPYPDPAALQVETIQTWDTRAGDLITRAQSSRSGVDPEEGAPQPPQLTELAEVRARLSTPGCGAAGVVWRQGG